MHKKLYSRNFGLTQAISLWWLALINNSDQNQKMFSFEFQLEWTKLSNKSVFLPLEVIVINEQCYGAIRSQTEGEQSFSWVGHWTDLLIFHIAVRVHLHMGHLNLCYTKSQMTKFYNTLCFHNSNSTILPTFFAPWPESKMMCCLLQIQTRVRTLRKADI